EVGVRKNGWAFEDAFRQRRARRISPFHVWLVRHAPPDRQGGSVQLFARPRRVDRRKGSRLDAVSTQLPSPPIEVAEVDTRRQLDRRPVAFELDEAARPE